MNIARGMLLLFLSVQHPTSTLASSNEANSAQERLYAAFGSPPYRISETKLRASLVEIEICSDLCDSFVLPTQRKTRELWDAILIFELYLSEDHTPRYEEFRQVNDEYGRKILDRHAAVLACGGSASLQSRASCVLDRIATKLRIQYAVVRYDEGYRCKAVMHFRSLNKIDEAKSGCVADKEVR